MVAFIPLLLSSLSAFAIAAPAQSSPSDVSQQIQKADSNIKAVLPNITAAADSSSPAQTLEDLLKSIEKDVGSILTEVLSEVGSLLGSGGNQDLSSVKNSLSGLTETLQKASSASSDTGNKVDGSAKDISSSLSQVLGGVVNLLQGLLGSVSSLL